MVNERKTMYGNLPLSVKRKKMGRSLYTGCYLKTADAHKLDMVASLCAYTLRFSS